MKAVFFYTSKFTFLLLFLACVAFANAQSKDTSALQMSERINARKFVFKAQTATPQTGGLVQLNYQYDLKLSGDSLVSYLPYYGRAFVAPINPQDGGLEFTTTDFTYESKKAGDDKWEINIATKALRDNYKLFFTIYTNGQAQLQVTSNNRQPIRFDGEVVGWPVK